MDREAPRNDVDRPEVRLVDYLDAEDGILIPEGVTLISHLDRKTRELGGAPAYRFLDYSREDDGSAVELTWTELGPIGVAVALLA